MRNMLKNVASQGLTHLSSFKKRIYNMELVCRLGVFLIIRDGEDKILVSEHINLVCNNKGFSTFHYDIPCALPYQIHNIIRLAITKVW